MAMLMRQNVKSHVKICQDSVPAFACQSPAGWYGAPLSGPYPCRPAGKESHRDASCFYNLLYIINIYITNIIYI